MLKNYFLTSFRFIIRNPAYSLINITGLAVGMTAAMLILMYVMHEFSYDGFHSNKNELYRVFAKVEYAGQSFNVVTMSGPLAPAVKESSPEVRDFVRVRESGRAVIKSDDNHRFYENNILFADNSFFTVFSFPLVKGSPATALTARNRVVLSRSTATKYFGNDDPIGKTIVYNFDHEFEVAGVAEDAPSNSSIQFSLVVSFPTLGNLSSEKNDFESATIGSGPYSTFLLLSDIRARDKVQAALAALQTKSNDNQEKAFTLNAFVTGRLFSIGDFTSKGYLYVFLGTGAIVLLLALVNYMSLTTAKATVRSKEVGIRKVIGAQRSSLAKQFYFESTLVTSLAFVLAFVLLQSLLPVFLSVLQLKIDTVFLTDPWFLGVVSIMFLSSILVAGSYPTFVLSRFVPADVLKGKLSKISGARIRSSLTVFQFSISIALIICSLIVQYQLNFMRDKNVGFNREHVLALPLESSMATSYNAFRAEIGQQSGVLGVTTSARPLLGGFQAMMMTKTPTTQEQLFIAFSTVDENFIPLLGIEWKEKFFDVLPQKYVVINEAAIEKLKIDGPIKGHKLEFGGSLEIAGIVKNFHIQSPKNKVQPLAIIVSTGNTSGLLSSGGTAYVRLSPASPIREQMVQIEKICRKFQAEVPFDFYFLDDAFDKLYKTEDRLARICQAFTAIAIFIASMGLLGLITFSAEMRTKEIGIRKVLGASVKSIAVLLSSGFIKPLLISIVISAPLAWWAMDRWLQDFSYRVEIPWWAFAVSGVLALAISIATIAYKTFQSAMMNPVDSLRND